jgi:hypothetical protein
MRIVIAPMSKQIVTIAAGGSGRGIVGTNSTISQFEDKDNCRKNKGETVSGNQGKVVSKQSADEPQPRSEGQHQRPAE